MPSQARKLLISKLIFQAISENSFHAGNVFSLVSQIEMKDICWKNEGDLLENF